MAAAAIPAIIGAFQSFTKAKSAKRARKSRESELQRFLRAFFPESFPGGSFGANFLAQGNNRIGLKQTNLSNQLLALLGSQGNLGGGLQGGGQAAIGLAGNAQRNQLPPNLAQFQTQARATGINAFNQGEAFNDRGSESSLAALLGGATQGLGAGLDAGLSFGFGSGGGGGGFGGGGNQQQQQPGAQNFGTTPIRPSGRFDFGLQAEPF